MTTAKASGKDQQPTSLAALLTEIAATDPLATYGPMKAGDEVLGPASDFLLRLLARRTAGKRHAEVLTVQARYESDRKERERMFGQIAELAAKHTLLDVLYAFQLSQDYPNLAGRRVVLRKTRDGVFAVVTRTDMEAHRQTMANLHHLTEAFLEDSSGGDHDCRNPSSNDDFMGASDLPPEVAAILKAMGVPLDRVRVQRMGGVQDI